MHFVTFGTGAYAPHARALAKNALEVGRFDTAVAYGESDLSNEFRRSRSEVLQIERGFGAWSWKSYIISKRLAQLEDGAVLAYCDSLYSFKRDARETVEGWLRDRDLVLFHNKPSEHIFLERHWSKYDAFHVLGANLTVHGQTPQVWAGFVCLRKTFDTVALVREWSDRCADVRLMCDAPSIYGHEAPGFVEGRHDQTVLSLLSKIRRLGVPFIDFPSDLLFNLRVGR